MIETLSNTHSNLLIRHNEENICENLNPFLENSKTILIASKNSEVKNIKNYFSSAIKNEILGKNQKEVSLLEEYLIITNPERLDKKIRFYPSNRWLGEVKTIIFYDFDLLLNETRGNKIESILLRARRLNPYIRLISLTERITNIEEISVWCKFCFFDLSGGGEEKFVSNFYREENVLEQTLAEIVSSSSRNIRELKSFFKSSFAHFQGEDLPNIEKYVRKLVEQKLIIIKENRFYPTGLGKICAGMYFPLKFQLKVISDLNSGKSISEIKERAKKEDFGNLPWRHSVIDKIANYLGEGDG